MQYQLAEKNKIMSLFHKGKTVSQIRLQSNVSKSTLYRWKEEYEATGLVIGLIQKGQIEEAKQCINQFQKLHPNSNELFTSKIVNQLINFGYLAYAKELAEKVLERNPNNTRVISQLIKIEKMNGNMSVVEQLCERALQLGPDSVATISQLIVCKKQKGNWEAVEQLCERRLQLEPDSVVTMSQLITCKKQKGDWEAVEQLCERILQLEPDSVATISQLIVCKKQKGNWEAVEQLCERRLQLEPDSVVTMSQLITCKKQKGDWEAVEQLCERILQLKPDNAVARQQLVTCKKQLKQKNNTNKPVKKTNENAQGKRPNINEPIKRIRQRIQVGTFLLDNIAERQKEMEEMGINEVYRNILIAEAYERQNLPKQTREYLKRALQGTQDQNLQKIIKSLLQAAQTTKKKPSHKSPWNAIASISSSNNKGQVIKTAKVPEEK